jgi:malate dehydrogenase (oxaloacetate-decarboxylating)(NADP+)
LSEILCAFFKRPFNKDGVISSERNDLSALQKKYSKGKPGITLGDALKGADVF